MKNILLITLIGLGLNLFAQMQTPDLKFVFDTKSEFTKQFEDKENSKTFKLRVEGLTSQADVVNLKRVIENARGVENFVTEINSNGKLLAKITVYRYATGFWYWKTFMEKTGVSIFSIEGVDYNINTITTIK